MVEAKLSENAFAPYRGTEAQIQAFGTKPGAVYFAYDTNKIFFDDGAGERHVMSGSGIKFVYGICADDLIADATHDMLLPYPRSAIEIAYTQMNKPVETYMVDDIIINHDGTLYRIKQIDDTHCYCEKLLVSGTGGGGGDANAITIQVVQGTPGTIARGKDVVLKIRIIDTKLGSSATLTCSFFASATAEEPYRAEESWYRVPVNQGSGEYYTITIPAAYLRVGRNQLKLQATVNGRQSELTWLDEMQVVDIHLVPTSFWNPNELKNSNDLNNFNFPYSLTYDTSGMTAEEFQSVVRIANPTITATVDAGSADLNTTENIVIDSNNRGTLSLSTLFESVHHGNHTLDIHAEMTINGSVVEITDNLHYEIGWYESGNNTPIIWSNFPHSAEFENYTLITIPFMVYDPISPTAATVSYYINDVLSHTAEIAYSSTSYANWEVGSYQVGSNVFMIKCREAVWSAQVDIFQNTRYTLEPEPGAILELNATGRTNQEALTKRVVWDNKSTISNNNVLKVHNETTDTYEDAPIELRNFNWYNNGWLKDSDSNTVLRVSNGASVYIPTTLFERGIDQTYEFEFAVHNAVDYSRLINEQTVYLKWDELATTVKEIVVDPETEEKTNVYYDPSEYTEDSEGYALDADLNKVPKINLATGSEVAERVVSTDGKGAFLTYYASNKGIILGTQEAFLALSQAQVVSARYTDDARVKISFVVANHPTFTLADGTERYSADPLIFAYINGVLTNILPYTSGSNFDQSFVNNTNGQTKPGIYITSTYCDVDIYNIRIYNSALQFGGITQNWTADGATLKIKKERYDKNQGILDANKHYIDYANAKQAKLLPIMVLKTYEYGGITGVQDELPFYKGNKIGIDVRYYDPFDKDRCWHASHVQANVQGTSSQGYPRRNFKISLKASSKDWMNETKMQPYGGAHYFKIAAWDGDEANKDVYDTSIPNPYIKFSAGKDKKTGEADPTANKGTLDIGCTIGNDVRQLNMKAKSFCLKADYMDSSSSHNTVGANLVSYLAGTYGSYDLRHPLTRILNSAEPYRTTVFGFPILVFWENMAGDIQFIGRYNLNVDKSSENVFGFTDETKHPYLDELEVIDDETEGTTKTLTGDDVTYEQVTECWELTNNQAGPSKFQDDEVGDTWFKQDQTTINGQPVSYFEIEEHFEQRYPEMAGTNYKGSEGAGNEFEWRNRTKNLHRLWDWIRQTDVTSYAGARKAEQPVRTITPIYYKTLSTNYEDGITYYTYDSTNDTYTQANVSVANTARVKGMYIQESSKLTKDDNGNITDTNYSTHSSVVLTWLENGQATFWNYLRTLTGVSNKDNDLVGDHVISRVSLTLRDYLTSYVDNGTLYVGHLVDQTALDNNIWVWFYGDSVIGPEKELSLALDDDPDNPIVINDISTKLGFTFTTSLNIKTLIFETKIEISGFNTQLFEYFTIDNDRYRLAKFKNEIRKHLNLDYCLFYFIFTEFFLLYDSRQKNMMLASWGPEEEGGEYIWYPIFYDLDTMLGINNSGQVYWDYDVDATPPLAMRTIFKNGQADVEVYSTTGSTDSIFSGNGSVLWNNMRLCFATEIANMYKALRHTFTEQVTKKFFEEYSSNVWSESMKNFDAYYKYIAPAIEGYRTTSTNPDLRIDKTTDYYYCLQGDRSLQRVSMIRNRFNYIDSSWGAEGYDATNLALQVKMRYNLNDKDRTSDTNTPAMEEYDSNATFTITPYLSQYVSVIYDSTSSDVKKFKLGGSNTSVVIDPPNSIGSRAHLGVALTQQLAYIRGPQYLSSMGDLAPKYCNELVVSAASRLRDLKVGDERPDYKNDNLTSLQIGAKGLLRSVDLSNLSKLTVDPQISGCPKLEEVKLLGTNIGALALPEGNILKRVYLPATLNAISLITPLNLTRILTNRETQASYGHNEDGLYIDGLTNMLDRNPEEDGTINTAIETYQMDDTKMGYDTYRMLDWLYRLKLQKQRGYLAANNTTSETLRLHLTNVDWTPYVQLTVDDGAFDSTKLNDYYVRDYIEYKSFKDNYVYDPVSWAKMVRNGEIYYKDSQKGESPLTNLDMFRYMCDQKDSTATTLQTYYFRPLLSQEQAYQDLRKLVPTITGRIHIHNADESLPAINEAEVFSFFQREDHFPLLDITADKIIAANRARFIEYMPDGSIHEFGTQKYFDGVAGTTSTVTYSFDQPERLHYDFLGWVVQSTNDTYDWEANGSVRNEWSRDNNQCINLSSYDLTSTSYTFIAVYSIHGYTITYMMDDGVTPATVYDFATQQEVQMTSIAVSGAYVDFADFTPWKDDSELPTFETYRFKGWRLTTEDDARVFTNTSTPRLSVDMDTTVYAKFERESVYANPLTVNELIIQKDSNIEDGVCVTVPVRRGLKGKICIPNQITWAAPGEAAKTWRVVKLLGPGAENDSATLRRVGNTDTDGGNLSYQPYLTHVFFEGCNPNDTKVCYITQFLQFNFYADPALRYVDIPDGLTTIGNNCFQNVALSAEMRDFKNVMNFNAVCFYSAFQRASEELNGEFELYVSASAFESNIQYGSGSIGNNSFVSQYINYITIGSRQKPLTTSFNPNLLMSGNSSKNVFHSALKKMTIYVNSDVDQSAVTAAMQGACAAGGSLEITYITVG